MYAWAQLQPKLMHPPSPRQTPGRRAGPRPGAAREGRGRPEETDGPLPQLGEGPHNAGVGWPEPTDGGGGERGANTVLTPPPTAALKCWAKGGQAHPPKPDHPHPQATPSVDRKASLGPHEQGDLLRRAVLQRVVLGREGTLGSCNPCRGWGDRAGLDCNTPENEQNPGQRYPLHISPSEPCG